MKKISYLAIAFLAAVSVSCNQSGKSVKTETTMAHSMTAMEGSDTLDACSHTSKITWIGSKPGRDHHGTILLKDGGKILLDGEKLVGGTFIIDMNTIEDIDLEDTAMNAKLVNHLKSAAFFNVDSFPEATFVITSVKPLEKNSNSEFTHQIDGNLTIKGITNGISFKAKIWFVNKKLYADSEDIVLDRTQWHVNYGSKTVFSELKDKFIDDNFTINIQLRSM